VLPPEIAKEGGPASSKRTWKLGSRERFSAAAKPPGPLPIIIASYSSNFSLNAKIIV